MILFSPLFANPLTSMFDRMNLLRAISPQAYASLNTWLTGQPSYGAFQSQLQANLQAQQQLTHGYTPAQLQRVLGPGYQSFRVGNGTFSISRDGEKMMGTGFENREHLAASAQWLDQNLAPNDPRRRALQRLIQAKNDGTAETVSAERLRNIMGAAAALKT